MNIKICIINVLWVFQYDKYYKILFLFYNIKTKFFFILIIYKYTIQNNIIIKINICIYSFNIK